MSTSALRTDPEASARSLAGDRTGRDPTPREADASLMAALLRKDPAAGDELYARYAARIHGLGLVLLKNPADAEDLVQDTFLKVWRTGTAPAPGRSAFDPGRGSLEAWILLIARGRAIDILRRRRLEASRLASQPSGSEASGEPGPEWHAELGDLIRRAGKEMDRLPAGQRAAVKLAYLGQRSCTEIAALQRIPPGTVKSRIRAGIASLRQTLAETGSTHPTSRPRQRRERIARSGGARSHEGNPHPEAEGSAAVFLGSGRAARLPGPEQRQAFRRANPGSGSHLLVCGRPLTRAAGAVPVSTILADAPGVGRKPEGQTP